MPDEIFGPDFHLTEPIRSISDPDRLIAAYFQSSTVGLCTLDAELRYVSINNALASSEKPEEFCLVRKGPPSVWD